MRNDSKPGHISSNLTDSAVESIRPGNLRAAGSNATKRAWLVQFDGREERVEADDVEITDSGVLVFYRLSSGMAQERTLLTAFSPGLCWRCELVSER